MTQEVRSLVFTCPQESITSIWKSLQNYLEVILNSLEIEAGSFFNVKLYILNISPNMNSKNGENQNLMFKSQHLVMNPGQAPALKCAPGPESMTD